MSDNKHTPGPWAWDRGVLRSPGMPGRHVVLNTFDGGERFLHGPDRKLIAAAPDLLAACEALVLAMVGTLDEKQKAINQAGAAIKKAKGE